MNRYNLRRRLRVIALTNILPPYRMALYRFLGQQNDLDLRLVLLAPTEPNRRWHLKTDETEPVQILPGRSLYLKRWELAVHINFRLEREIVKTAPDVLVLGGWDQLSYWRAALVAGSRGIPVVLQNESSLGSARYSRSIAAWIKRQMVRRSSAFVAYGSGAREYLLRLGAPDQRIHEGLNTVDVEDISATVTNYRRSRDYVKRRAAYGKVVILYVGQLIPRKGVASLLYAMAGARIGDASLLIVGDGPEAGRLQQLAQELGLRNVTFLGFQEPPALWNTYALADVAVVPSLREVWGLVVNEAVASGLYVICSDQVGAARDVIRIGLNGEVVPAGDVQAWAAALRRVVCGVDQIRARRAFIMDDARRRLGISQLAVAVRAAINDAVTHRGGS